jgi:hypothetical protein
MHRSSGLRVTRNRPPSLGDEEPWRPEPSLIPSLLLMLPPILLAGTAGLTGPAIPFPTLDPSSAEEPSSFLVYADIQGNYRRGHDALASRALGERTETDFKEIGPAHFSTLRAPQ